jgi:hypothetical protein
MGYVNNGHFMGYIWDIYDIKHYPYENI